MDKNTIIESARLLDWNTYSGIYYLIDTDEIVYIGQSVNVMARIAAHVLEGEKKFTHYYVVEAHPQKLDELEAEAIMLHLPKYNKALPHNPLFKEIGYFSQTTGMSPEILARLFHVKVRTFELGGRVYYSVVDAANALTKLLG